MAHRLYWHGMEQVRKRECRGESTRGERFEFDAPTLYAELFDVL